MGVVVLDSSVAMKWFFDEAGSDAAAALLSSSDSLHAPELLLLECDAVVCVEVRRGNLTRAKAREIRATLRGAGVALHPLGELLDAGVEASIATGKALYDCVYLVLAEALDATLITADRRFVDSLDRGPFRGRVSLLGRA